ncbi:OmpA family protein [Kaistia terrae]|uniref:OmpA family protein n=1 Tax=Kaistia terrae TaxID=537017 RepID=A0ABW0PSN9_9HYPH|nr:OmpA family protein [Kaistia terrae]MCX5577581.1 OmpA family protein [Kaistia terrae]
MKPSQFILFSSVAIPVLLGGSSLAFGQEARLDNRPMVVAQAEDRVARARQLLEQAQESLKQAEDTGGDVRAARRGVADAMKDLRAAESAGGGGASAPAPRAPAETEPTRPAPRQAEPNPRPDNGGQPKAYQPPAGAKKPDAPAAKPAPDATPTPDRKPAPPAQSEQRPKPQQPPKGQPDARPAPDRRPDATSNRPPRGEQGRPNSARPGDDRPRPDARPPRPGDNDSSYRDDYREPPRQRDIFIDGPGLGDREVPPPPGYGGRPYRSNNRFIDGGRATERQIEDTFRAAPVQRLDRGYSMNEIRRDPRVRDMVRRVDLDAITFEFGSARVPDDQVRKLKSIGRAISRVVDRNPGAVFLIEGHTDAVGTDFANLELSDRRAASVAGILSDYFDIPRDALVSQGYGERYLKIPTDGPERQNRRVTIRNITPLLQGR